MVYGIWYMVHFVMLGDEESFSKKIIKENDEKMPVGSTLKEISEFYCPNCHSDSWHVLDHSYQCDQNHRWYIWINDKTSEYTYIRSVDFDPRFVAHSIIKE